MKVLIVATSFGEFSDSHTIRIENMLSTFGKNELFFIGCASGSEIITTKKSIIFPLPIIVRWISQLGSKSFVYKILINLYRYIFGDVFHGFAKSTQKKLKKSTFDLSTFDLILSSSGSFETHKLGSYLARKHNLKHVMDYGDPISPLTRGPYRLVNVILEKKILGNADLVTFTTKSTEQQYLKLFGPLNTDVIQYGAPKPTQKAGQNDAFKVGYFGAAFPNDRDLTNLIEVIGGRLNLELTLAGRISRRFVDMAAKYSNISYLGKVTYEDSLEKQARLDLNVIVGNKDGRQLPGKVFVSLSIMVPILYIQQCDPSEDEAYLLLSKFEGVKCISNDTNNIACVIENLLSNPPVSFNRNIDNISIEAESKKFKELLCKL